METSGIRFFGVRYDSAAYATAEHIDTPVGSICGYCDEPIAVQDDGWLIPHLGEKGMTHRECFLRALVGSVAHQQKRCSCFVPGSTEEDDPSLTPRQAARAALSLWEGKSPQ